MTKTFRVGVAYQTVQEFFVLAETPEEATDRLTTALKESNTIDFDIVSCEEDAQMAFMFMETPTKTVN